jgi:hypothetical protein
MMSKPQDLYAAAKAVAAIAKDEPLYRAAISRHYYSAYHQCVAYHANLPRPGRLGAATGRHEQLIAQLRSPDPKLADDVKDQSVAVGKLLRLVCSQRIESDYKLKTPVDAQAMADAVSNTAIIFRET